MQNEIFLSLVANDPSWAAALQAMTKLDASIDIPEIWWERFEAIGGRYWKEMIRLDQGRMDPSIVSWQKKRNRLEVHLHGGYIALDRAKCMVGLLAQAGCVEVEALVYTDGCETIIDERGTEHRLGLRFYIDTGGEVAETNYPEVAYEYYDGPVN